LDFSFFCIYFLIFYYYVFFFFFFQAEDGIRDFHVTGVQTCALPIYDDVFYAIDDPYITVFIVSAQIAGAKPSVNKRFFRRFRIRSEEHTSELQSRENLVCRLLLEKKKKQYINHTRLTSYTVILH